jgi:hypothetical protein
MIGAQRRQLGHSAVRSHADRILHPAITQHPFAVTQPSPNPYAPFIHAVDSALDGRGIHRRTANRITTKTCADRAAALVRARAYARGHARCMVIAEVTFG